MTVDAIFDEETSPARNTALMERATVDSIVAKRNIAVEKCRESYMAMVAANQSIQEAQDAVQEAAPEEVSSYTFGSRSYNEVLASPKIPSAEEFMKDVQHLIDVHVWSHIIRLTDMESLMDHKEKEAMRSSLQTDPPEVTVDNVYATLKRFMLDADMIWKRGLANTFSGLDRRFRSHNGWRLGSRIILSYAFNRDTGGWNYRRSQEDQLMDAERAFFILDGRTPPKSWHGIVQAVDASRRGQWGPRQSSVETEFFKVRTFKNGNCHLWFMREDLVEKANKVLADYYGEVLSDGDAHEPKTEHEAKTSVARHFGHYPTPEPVAERVIEAANLYRRDGEPLKRVLEPSAGGGNIARLAAEKGARVDCIEIQEHLCGILKGAGLYANVWMADFLDRTPMPIYDAVVMNPPFDRERDIDHVLHAMKFLNETGVLVSVMSAGTEFRETAKSRHFRDKMAGLHAMWRDLPAGSFASVGTNVNTRLLKVYKNGCKQSYWS